MTTLQGLLENGIRKGMTYGHYLEQITEFAAKGTTSGPEQRQNLIEFTRLNAFRMQRLTKTTALEKHLVELISKVNTPCYWLVLTETWCGDAAQNIPILDAMRQCSPLIELRIVYRDEHPDLMGHFLTNGGAAIPKLIALDTDYRVLFTWGPRPKPAQEMIYEYQKGALGDVPYAHVSLAIQKWYLKDNAQTIQQEFAQSIQQNLVKENGTIPLK